MTPQEQSMIDDLIARIRNTPVTDKDVEAERHLQQTLGNVPDALYVLTQTVLVQQYGLEQAQAQLQAKQEELDALKRQQDTSSHTASKSGGSFLSRIFGPDENAAAPTQAPATPNPGSGYQPVNYAPPTQGSYPPLPPYGGQAYPGAGYGGPAYGSAPGAFGGGPFGGGGFGGGGGFLRGALQTAAGVAAGAMVFEGMEDLFRGFGGHESRGFGNMPGETVVNNYYGDEGERGNTRGLDGSDDSGFYNPAHDASREDAGSDSRGFADTGSGVDNNDDSSDDDSSNSFDDSSDFSDNDDSGSSDSGDDSSY